MFVEKFSWYLEKYIDDIDKLILISDKGKEEWSCVEEGYRYRFKIFDRVVSKKEFIEFCNKVGLNFYSEVWIWEKCGKRHKYVYTQRYRRQLRKDYYRRNKLQIPESDWLVADFDKWNWFKWDMLKKVKNLWVTYRDGRKVKFTRNSNGYFRYSKVHKMWYPCDGFAFCLSEIESVMIEDFSGYIHNYKYSKNDKERLSKF